MLRLHKFSGGEEEEGVLLLPPWRSTIWWRISFGCSSAGLAYITFTSAGTIKVSYGSPPARGTSDSGGCAISTGSQPT